MIAFSVVAAACSQDVPPDAADPSGSPDATTPIRGADAARASGKKGGEPTPATAGAAGAVKAAGALKAADAAVDGPVDGAADAAPEIAVVDVPSVDAAVRGMTIVTYPGDRFFDVPDAPIRQALATGAVVAVKRGSGGRSLGFKLTLEDGTKGYFKPEQSFSAANWFSEVAAYHLDRMIGLHRVPAVVSRQLPWEVIRRAAGSDKRRKELTIRRDGTMRGAFVSWIPGGLRRWAMLPGWERWIRMRGWPTTVVTPFQRPAVWKRQLDRKKEVGDKWLSAEQRQRRRRFNPKPDRPDRAQEVADMIVFDYLTKNIDRWGGNNANVLTRGKGEPLVFLDNAAGFAPGRARPSLMEARLHVIHKFRRSTIDGIKAFSMERFRERLATEPLAPILGTREYRHLAERREALLKWVARMEKRYGERIYTWE